MNATARTLYVGLAREEARPVHHRARAARRRSQRFLRRVWSQRRFVHDRWWESAAVNHLLGYRRLRELRRHAAVGV